MKGIMALHVIFLIFTINIHQDDLPLGHGVSNKNSHNAIVSKKSTPHLLKTQYNNNLLLFNNYTKSV
jgi:hypothetical protein